MNLWKNMKIILENGLKQLDRQLLKKRVENLKKIQL